MKEYCPNAALCIGPFHVVSWATDALDEVRRRAWSEANRIAREVPKRHVGRPKNGETESPEKRLAGDLKATRYALLKNPQNLTEHQEEQLKFLTTANPRLYRAYLLKEDLRLACYLIRYCPIYRLILMALHLKTSVCNSKVPFLLRKLLHVH